MDAGRTDEGTVEKGRQRQDQASHADHLAEELLVILEDRSDGITVLAHDGYGSSYVCLSFDLRLDFSHTDRPL